MTPRGGGRRTERWMTPSLGGGGGAPIVCDNLLIYLCSRDNLSPPLFRVVCRSIRRLWVRNPLGPDSCETTPTRGTLLPFVPRTLTWGINRLSEM